MLSGLAEDCDTACNSNSKGPCYEEGMRAIGDITQFKYVADKLMPGEYECDSQSYGGAQNWAPALLYDYLCIWSPTGSSCAGKVDDTQRLCCCGNGMCPLKD